MKRWIVAVSAVIVLATSNYAIYQRERLLANGQVVLLRLAPVDPRSLMQGDYMALQFSVALEARANTALDALPQDGRLLLTLDQNQVGHFAGFDSDPTQRRDDQVRMRYRVRNQRMKFATNAFFFEEGSAHIYQQAQYGQFRVGPDGASILVAMFDGDFNKLSPQP